MQANLLCIGNKNNFKLAKFGTTKAHVSLIGQMEDCQQPIPKSNTWLANANIVKAICGVLPHRNDRVPPAHYLGGGRRCRSMMTSQTTRTPNGGLDSDRQT